MSALCMCGDYRDGYHDTEGRCLRPGCPCEGFIDSALLAPPWAKEASASLDAMSGPGNLGTKILSRAAPGETPTDRRALASGGDHGSNDGRK